MTLTAGMVTTVAMTGKRTVSSAALHSWSEKIIVWNCLLSPSAVWGFWGTFSLHVAPAHLAPVKIVGDSFPYTGYFGQLCLSQILVSPGQLQETLELATRRLSAQVYALEIWGHSEVGEGVNLWDPQPELRDRHRPLRTLDRS